MSAASRNAGRKIWPYYINTLIINSMQKKKPYCRNIMYAIFSAVAMLLLPMSSFAQSGGITLQVEKAPLGEVLEQIEDDYGYLFLYRNSFP